MSNEIRSWQCFALSEMNVYCFEKSWTWNVYGKSVGDVGHHTAIVIMCRIYIGVS